MKFDLSSNNVSHLIRAGTFSSNPNLRFVSLAHNAIRSVETGAFGKSLEHVWLTGNSLTCAELGGLIPSGAGCTDESDCGAMNGVVDFGDGVCHGELDPPIDTAACLWDGGDCSEANG